VERDIEDGGRVTALKIAILSPVPEYEEDWSLIRADYVRLFGEDTAFIDWTQADDLDGFDLATPLLAWGYQRHCPKWFTLLDRLEANRAPVANPVRVLRWNSDKSYLAELAEAGVATVPTRMCENLTPGALDAARAAFGTDRLVVKPPVSGGADGTYLLGPDDAIPDRVAGQRMMIQPYQTSIAKEGEYSLFYFNGAFSHSIIKRPAAGDFRVQDQFGGWEGAIAAPAEAKELAVAALTATSHITGSGPLAYARVDMLRDGDGHFRLMELELIEPSLFLRFASDRGAAFAEALVSRNWTLMMLPRVIP
jgi:glutathione synthase/RimK-type ligase-like ATP-grasp enzyme